MDNKRLAAVVTGERPNLNELLIPWWPPITDFVYYSIRTLNNLMNQILKKINVSTVKEDCDGLAGRAGCASARGLRERQAEWSGRRGGGQHLRSSGVAFRASALLRNSKKLNYIWNVLPLFFFTTLLKNKQEKRKERFVRTTRTWCPRHSRQTTMNKLVKHGMFKGSENYGDKTP